MFSARLVRRLLAFNLPLPLLVFVCIVGIFSLLRLSETSVSTKICVFEFYLLAKEPHFTIIDFRRQ